MSRRVVITGVGLFSPLGNTAEKPWDLNIAEPGPVLRLPKAENRAAAEFVLKARGELQAKLEARNARARELAAAYLGWTEPWNVRGRMVVGRDPVAASPQTRGISQRWT